MGFQTRPLKESDPEWTMPFKSGWIQTLRWKIFGISAFESQVLKEIERKISRGEPVSYYQRGFYDAAKENLNEK